MFACPPPRAELPPLGVNGPFDVAKLRAAGSGCDGGAKVLSRWVEDADDSLAESGCVGCFKATRDHLSLERARYCWDKIT